MEHCTRSSSGRAGKTIATLRLFASKRLPKVSCKNQSGWPLGFLCFRVEWLKVTNRMKRQLHFFLLTGWLIPFGIALVFFGMWIIDIVIPTLKGGNLDRLYDLHQIRYLDTTLASTVVAFAWVGIAVFRWARRQTKTETVT